MKKKYWLMTLGIVLVCLGLYIVKVKGYPTYGRSITFRGKYICLEHKSQNWPQTLECGGGFSNGSKVYEIDNEDYYQAHPGMNEIGGGEYEVTGTLERPGDFYASDGIIKITNLKLVK
jgi:hypothetical protein